MATFTDSAANATAAGFSASINWGDGTTSPADSHAVQVIADPQVAGRFDVQGTHTFIKGGQLSLQVTVTDTVNGGAATTASVTQANLVTDNQGILTSLGFAPAAHTDVSTATVCWL